MKAHTRKNIIRMAATSIVASSVLAMASPASATEHVLLARQIGVPSSEASGITKVGTGTLILTATAKSSSGERPVESLSLNF